MLSVGGTDINGLVGRDQESTELGDSKNFESVANLETWNIIRLDRIRLYWESLK